MTTLLLVTTTEDLSVDFFRHVPSVECDVIDYSQPIPDGLRSQYDVIYFRDPFVVKNYDIASIAELVEQLASQYPDA